jgi:hypothetical protein
MIAFFTSAACPAGWNESASAQGRVLVGITDAAERESIGKPLADREAPRHEHGFAADIMRDARLVPVNSPLDSAAQYIEVLESDTPREAGGLMSWAASKAVVRESRRRAKARLG